MTQSGEEDSDQTDTVPFPTLPLTSCVTLEKFLNFSELVSLSINGEKVISTSQGCCDDSVR